MKNNKALIIPNIFIVLNIVFYDSILYYTYFIEHQFIFKDFCIMAFMFNLVIPIIYVILLKIINKKLSIEQKSNYKGVLIFISNGFK